MEKPSATLSKWLDTLERDSWNMELLISGFSIFLLITLLDKLFSFFGNIWSATGQSQATLNIINALMVVLALGAITLTINLIVHIILRGFWIGGIGLRSVSKEIPVERLRYAEPFASILKDRMPSLDQIIIRLDRICSGVFAFSFLIVLMFFSFFMVLLVMLLVFFLISQLGHLAPVGWLQSVVSIINLLFRAAWILISVIYLLDTLSLGFFKRQRWLARFYYPIYRLYGQITFAYIYRTIYYHLITNYSRRKIQLALAVYLLGFLSLPFVKYDQVIFFPDTPAYTEMRTNHYDDLRPGKEYIIDVSIPGRLIQEGFLPLFIRYNVNDNKQIAAQCGDYTPSKKGGWVSGIQIRRGFKVRVGDPLVREADPKALLGCMERFYAIYVDSAHVENAAFYYFRHPQHEQSGVQVMLDIRHLDDGAHLLQVYKHRSNGKREEVPFVHIPFWKI